MMTWQNGICTGLFLLWVSLHCWIYCGNNLTNKNAARFMYKSCLFIGSFLIVASINHLIMSTLK